MREEPTVPQIATIYVLGGFRTLWDEDGCHPVLAYLPIDGLLFLVGEDGFRFDGRPG